jgi:hypothetical protein
MVMPLNMFGINIQLIDVYAVECLPYNHSTWMVMLLNVFNLDGYAVITQHGWLCR